MIRKTLAESLGTNIDIVNKICKDLGIEGNEIKDDEVIDIKIKYLDLYKNNIVKERDQLKDDRREFEKDKQEEKNKIKERQREDEIKHKQKLEEIRMKKLEELSNDFQERLSKEYEVVKEKFVEIAQKESEIQEKEIKYKVFETKKELFESQKEKLLNEYKQELEIKKEISYNESENQRVKKLEEINKTIEALYSDKEKELEMQGESLREQDAQLKTQIAEVKAKEKSLELQGDSLYKQAQEKVEEEIKAHQEKIESFKKQNQSLREELSDLREELDSYEKFEDRDLPRELDEKQSEISRLKKLLEETTDQKNKFKDQVNRKKIEYENRLENVMEQNTTLLNSNKERESLKSQNILNEDKIRSLNNHIEFVQGENKDLNDRLKSIYSDGTEIEERIKDIKEKPYKEIKLESKINITDEIKYLDSIQTNMKSYGVEYPKRLLYAFHTALKSAEFSPLAVLSGVSGTGKSELPKLYSHFGGFNFLAEAVQPTWDSPASMIGYYNTIDRKFDSTNILKFLLQTSQSKNEAPFGLKESMNMVLLDEMNLAHIELYFAEFLSKFELRRGSNGVNLDIQLGTALNYPLPLDRNVLWIGTMNEDETTKSLSDKVLDRSFSINFPRPTELKSRAKLQTLDEIKKFEYLHRDTWDKWIQKESLFTGDKSEVLEKYKEMSNQINQHLAPTGRAIGHRVWQSMEYYMNNHPLVIQNIDNEDELEKNVKLAFEEQLVQKIMPKLRGIEVHGKEKEALMSIKDILNQNDFKMTEDFELSMDNPYGQFIWNSANYLKED